MSGVTINGTVVRLNLFLVLSFGIIVFVGCGGVKKGQVATYPAEGVVTFDGEPLENASMIFLREPPLEAVEGKRVPVSAAQSLEDGTFRVNTYGNGDGLPEGEYRVTVSCEDRAKPLKDGYGNEIRGEYHELLPARYGDPNTSELRVSIVKGKNEFPEFKLVH